MRGGIPVVFLLITSAIALKFVEDDLLLYWRRSNTSPCEPFTTFRVVCNRCVCSAEAVLYCTKMFCGNLGSEHNNVSEEEM